MQRVPDFNDGTHLQCYILDEYWETYLDRLACITTWADNTKLMALAVLFNIHVRRKFYELISVFFFVLHGKHAVCNFMLSHCKINKIKLNQGILCH